ncbi:MAG: hypothetical protein KTR22_08080 [Flavobacteriaceae bacterium]|nr:hypothetical protein [Flavobacteriaceae bacterium]
MNYKKLLFILAITLTVVSCKKDDDGDSTFLLSNENIAGTYDMTYFTVDIVTTTEVQGIPVTANTDIVGDTFQVVLVMNENGSLTIEGEYRVTTTVEVGGVSETDTEILVLDDSGTYSIDANNQTITISGLDGFEVGTYEVTQFTQSEIRMVEMLTEETQTESSDITTEMRFVRQ